MRSKHTLIVLGGWMASLLVGCNSTHVSRSVVADTNGDDMDGQLDFWHSLATKSVTCNDDAFHGLLLDFDGTDTAKTYEDRVAALKKRSMLPGNFNRPADEAVSRGTVAIALCKQADIKGGIIMRATGGMVDRYALRELRYLDLLPPSSTNQSFSGTEFVGVIGRFEDYQRGNPADLPAFVMPSTVNHPH